MLQYYCYRLAVRLNDDTKFSGLHLGRKLFHQYIVDAYVKIEANRLNWIKMNQSLLHVEQFKGLMDHINAKTGGAVGRVTILPSTFQINFIL